MQYNACFYCMAMLYICLLTFFSIVTKKRKIQTRASYKEPLLPLNDCISPNNEINDVKGTPPAFQEEVQEEEHGKPINSLMLTF